MDSSSTSTPAKPKQQIINYSAFKLSRKAPQWLLYSGGAGVFILLLCMGYVISLAGQPQYQGAHGTGDGLFIFAFLAGFTTIFVSLAVYVWKQSAYAKSAFQQFIIDNDWVAQAEPSDEDVATSLLGVGDDRKITEAFTGTYKGLTFTALSYEFITDSGKSRDMHSFMNLRFQLKQTFPLAVLDNRHDQYISLLSNLPTRIPGGRELQLEGDFSQHYKVTVLPGTERDVLQVLTPDFMAEILDQASDADAEIVANKLFIIKHFDVIQTREKTLRDMFMMADVMIKNLGELASSWQASSSSETIQNIGNTAQAARQ